MTLALIPGFTYLLALAFFGDRLHPLKLVGVPLATGAALHYTTDGFAGFAADDGFRHCRGGGRGAELCALWPVLQAADRRPADHRRAAPSSPPRPS